MLLVPGPLIPGKDDLHYVRLLLTSKGFAKVYFRGKDDGGVACCCNVTVVCKCNYLDKGKQRQAGNVKKDGKDFTKFYPLSDKHSCLDDH